VTIALDNVNAAVVGVGVILSPGEYFVESTSEGYKAWSGDIKAVASAAWGCGEYLRITRGEQWDLMQAGLMLAEFNK